MKLNVAQIISLFWAIALPAVSTSLYFHPKVQQDVQVYDPEQTEKDKKESDAVEPKCSGKTAASLLWTHFKNSYSDSTVVLWSLWWALAMCGFVQVHTC